MIHSENMKWNREQIEDFKSKALHWASQFDVCMLLDNNFIENACSYQNVELMVAAGINRDVKCDVGNAFENLKKFHADTDTFTNSHVVPIHEATPKLWIPPTIKTHASPRNHSGTVEPNGTPRTGYTEAPSA